MTGQVPMLDDVLALAAELETTWPAHSAALRASGVLLNEEETPEEKTAREAAEAAAAAAAAAEAAAAAKPPWGDDFDAERAWKLVQNVRGDADKLKKERDALAAKVKEHDDSSKSDAQKLEERAATAEQQLTATTREATRLRVALDKNLTLTQAKRLVGDTEEELSADADELLADLKNGGSGDGGEGGRRSPKPRLRPGASGGAEPDETDPDKLAAQVPRS